MRSRTFVLPSFEDFSENLNFDKFNLSQLAARGIIKQYRRDPRRSNFYEV